jgi:DNA-binding NtrC family response regulator
MTVPSSPPPPPPQTLVGERYLLAHEHVHLVHAMKRILAAHGADVVTADSVDAALRTLEAEQGRFSVLLSRAIFCDGTGTDLMRQVRARWPAIHGVVITGFGLPDEVKSFHAAGFAVHLLSPVTSDKLIASLEGLRRPPD